MAVFVDNPDVEEVINFGEPMDKKKNLEEETPEKIIGMVIRQIRDDVNDQIEASRLEHENEGKEISFNLKGIIESIKIETKEKMQKIKLNIARLSSAAQRVKDRNQSLERLLLKERRKVLNLEAQEIRLLRKVEGVVKEREEAMERLKLSEERRMKLINAQIVLAKVTLQSLRVGEEGRLTTECLDVMFGKENEEEEEEVEYGEEGELIKSVSERIKTVEHIQKDLLEELIEN